MSKKQDTQEKLKQYVLKEIEKQNVEFIRLQFTDVPGNMKCCTVTKNNIENILDNGVFFDGSSIEGFVRIYESDMYLQPDLHTFSLLPWNGSHKEARIICDIYKPNGKPFEGDPRYILKRLLDKAKHKGFEYFVGPELEFFLFERDPTTGKILPKVQDVGGYFDLDPLDKAMDLKKKAIVAMEKLGTRLHDDARGKITGEKGINIEMSHHEVAEGQHEIDFKYTGALAAADSVMTYKYVMKRIATEHNLHASFMPKPIYGINGSGMHTNQSLWDIKKKSNAFVSDKDKYGLSDIAYSFIAGQLKHAREMSAVVAPTVNSYKRLVPGYEAPVYICWGRNNRSALIRVPRVFKGNISATRAELRCPDPSSNPYLAFASMLAAGLEGIEKKLEVPDPVEEDVYKFDDRKLSKFYIETLPASLGEALSVFEESSLMRRELGDFAFSKILETGKHHWNEYRLRVTQWELDTYLTML